MGEACVVGEGFGPGVGVREEAGEAGDEQGDFGEEGEVGVDCGPGAGGSVRVEGVEGPAAACGGRGEGWVEEDFGVLSMSAWSGGGSSGLVGKGQSSLP